MHENGFLAARRRIDAHLLAELADEQQLGAVDGKSTQLQRADQLRVVMAEDAGRRSRGQFRDDRIDDRVAQRRVVPFAHHAEAGGLRRGGWAYRCPGHDSRTLDDEVTHVVATKRGDESLRVSTLPGLERRALDGSDL